MNVTVNVVACDAAAEELRSLFAWLAGEEEFRGKVRLMEAAPDSGSLGGWPEAVEVALAQGGAITVLASAVISWIRHRSSELTCKITRLDGTSVELTAARVRCKDLTEIGKLIEQMAAALGEDNTQGNGERGSAE